MWLCPSSFLGGGGSIFVLKILFIQVLIILYAKFQPSTMSGYGQKFCYVVWVGVETNYSVKLKLLLKLNYMFKRVSKISFTNIKYSARTKCQCKSIPFQASLNKTLILLGCPLTLWGVPWHLKGVPPPLYKLVKILIISGLFSNILVNGFAYLEKVRRRLYN